MNPEIVYQGLRRAHGLTRREALVRVARLFGAASVAPLLAACGSDGGGSGDDRVLEPSELPIDHIVAVMMENRSFDHYFGSLSLVEGRRDVNGLTGLEENLLPSGEPVRPFALENFCVSDPPHGWGASRDQFADGANSGFVREHFGRVELERVARDVMGFHQRGQIPFYYGLAEEFALCDRWFCSVMGPTWPNRFFFHSADSGGAMSNFSFPNLRTTYDLLDEAGISWKYYFSDLPFLALYVRSLSRYGSRIAPVRQYFEDAARGELPTVAIVDPSFALSDDHPPHHVQLGQGFVSSVFHALADSPQWERSLFLLTYDEHGGFFDHVPPPKTVDARAAEGFDQLGFRVPAIVAGPWVKQGHISSTSYEHASFMRFVQWRFGLEALNERNAVANHFGDVLDAGRILARDPRPAPVLPEVVVDRSQIRPFCVIGTLTEIEQAADAGIIPPELDHRATARQTFEDIIRRLEPRGRGRLA